MVRLLIFILCLWGSLEARPFRSRYSCEIFHLALPEIEHGEVGFVNGMNHKPPRAVRCGAFLSKWANDHRVYVVYNPTGGFWPDLHKCFVELYHFRVTEPVRKLHQKWDLFFNRCKQDEKFLQFCHSQGTIQVRNALLCYPPHLRKRIIVVAIAPAAYISEDLCASVYHYASRRDIVPSIDHRGRARCKETLVTLTPHRRAAFFDHHFLSPTYQDVIHFHLTDYVKSCEY